jgi:hypothetical protein
MTSLRVVCVVLLALSLSACASTPAPERSERSGRAMLTNTEIHSTNYADAYSVVQSLRPEWLRAPAANSFRSSDQIQVYLDGNRMGGTDQLRQIMTRSIMSMQFLTGLEASQRWGLNHGGGAIVISTR